MARRAASCAPLLALVAAACASSGSGSSATSCVSNLPRDIRSLNEVVDSAALVQELTDIWPSAAALTIATIPYGPTGSLDTVRVLSEFLSPWEKQRLSNVLARNAMPRADSALSVRVFVGDGVGPSPRRVPNFQGCPPVLLNADVLADLAGMEAEKLPFVDRAGVVRVRTFINEQGAVEASYVDEPSTNRVLDEAAVRVMGMGSFSPALLEGIPFGSWAIIPVNFRRATRRGPLPAGFGMPRDALDPILPPPPPP